MSSRRNDHIRILTWNVNGLRAWLRKGAAEWVQSQNADIVCLQEIKANPEQLSKDQLEQLSGYRAYWNPAIRPGYSGVLTLAKPETQQVVYGLGDERFDGEGRVIAILQAGLWFFNVYYPNGRRDLSRLEYKIDFYEQMLERCDELHAAREELVIAGDFNTAHRSIDLKNPEANSKNTGFLPEERALIDKYLENGFIDAYREYYPKREQYTWWTYRYNARQRNIGWRLDYFLVSKRLGRRIKSVAIHDNVQGSDHCPVSLDLKI